MFNRAWLAGGIPRTACVAAYEPICAVSLADSYINRANPGTLDATAPVAAPTWAESTGWTFNGTTEYLTTGYTHTKLSSFIARFSGTTAGNLCGSFAATAYLYVLPNGSTGVRWRYGNGTSPTIAPVMSAGVVAISGGYYFRDGAQETSVGFQSIALIDGQGPFRIGALGEGPTTITNYFVGNVQAVYIYNVPITPTQVKAVTDAMNMLPMRPQLPRFRSWLTGGAVATQFRKAFGLRTGSRGVPE